MPTTRPTGNFPTESFYDDIGQVWMDELYPEIPQSSQVPPALRSAEHRPENLSVINQEKLSDF